MTNCKPTVIRSPDRSTRAVVNDMGPKRITLSRETVAKINDNRPKTATIASTTPIKTLDRHTTVKAGAGMGPQGAPGETEGATFLATCGATIHGDRVVRIANDVIFEPDTSVHSDALEVVGIAMQAGSTGSQILVRTAGVVTEGSWTWSPGIVYCGNGGQLTQSPDPTGWLLPIGHAKNATTIEIDIGQPIMRSP
ncbi:MAG TPA: hypothetical protein VLE97_01885 [Gaiellaceae bacterium]|nr:hypothetical protein [Gaiellaceae bacterium]